MKIDLQKLKSYFRNLQQKGISTAEMKQKLNSVDNFVNWADKKGLLTEDKYKQLNQGIAEIRKKISSIFYRIAPETWVNKLKKEVGKWVWKRETGIKKSKAERTPVRPWFNISPSEFDLRHYIGISMILLVMSAMGAAAYNQFFKEASTPFAFPANLTSGGRILSFQGRLTDSLGNPISTATNIKFKLYNGSTSGTTLYDSTACSLTPDQDGVFDVLIGGTSYSPTPPQDVCGTEIPENIFSDWPNVYLGVTVGSDSEASPRQQIANVGYAINAETLKGFPPGTGFSNIPYINSDGNIIIATSAAGIRNTWASTNFTLSSTGTITVQSAGTGDVALTATESGNITATTGSGTTLFNVLTGNLKVGNGTPGVTLGGEDAYIEGTFEVDGATTLDGALTANGNITFSSAQFLGASPLVFEGLTDDNITTTLAFTDPTVSNKTITFPNATGNVCLDTGNCAESGIGADILDFTEFEDTLDLDANLTLNQTTYTWAQDFTGTTGTGYTYSANSLTTGTGVSLGSTSTAGGASGSSKVLNIARSGTNSNATHTAYGLYSAVTNTGTTSINVGGYFSASGATNNYGLIVNAGNVGIGTTAPIDKLTINSEATAVGLGVRYHSTYPNLRGVILHGGNSAGILSAGGLQIAAQGADNSIDGSGKIVFFTTAVDSANGSTDATYVERMRILHGGNVGINTTAPQSLLDVQGAAGAAGILTLATKELTVVDGDVLGRIDFNAPLESDGLDAILVGASIWAEADDTFSTTVNSTELVFATGTSAAATEKMRIDRDGNVGIGTTAPGAKLEVADSTTPLVRIYNGGGATPNPRLELYRNSTAYGYVEYKPAGGSGDGLILHDARSDGAAKIIFSTYTGGEKMRITDAGSVGIGDTSPASLLTVGSGDLFQVDTAGDVVKLKNVTYSWPSSQGAASTVLTNNGSGTLTWGTLGAASIADDSLDFVDFEDTLDLDANLTLNQTTYTWAQDYTGTTGTGYTYSANSLTTGTGVSLGSTSTAGGASGSSKVLNIARSGANAQLAHTAYGIYSAVTNTNVTSGTNIAGYFSASGATTANYGLIVGAGDVGIGLTAPEANLHVSSADWVQAKFQSTSDGYAPASILLEAGGTNARGQGIFMYNNVSDESYFWGVPYSTSNDRVILSYANQAAWGSDVAQNASALMTVLKSGYVGIGTTNPLNKLDFGTSVPNVAKILTLYQSGTTMMGFGMSGSTAGMRIFGPTSTADEITFGSYDGTTYTEQMRINNLGNVGIGTTGPTAKLTLSNNVATGFLDTYAEYQEILYDGGTAALSYGFGIKGNTMVFNSGAGAYSFDDAAGSTSLQIDTDGKVGIGTTAPSQKLSVVGNIELDEAVGVTRYILTDEINTGTGRVTIQAGAGSAGYGGGLNLFAHSNTTKPGWVTAGLSASAGSGATEARFTVNDQGLAGGTDVFTVLRTGNVGIGTTSPTALLNLKGTLSSALTGTVSVSAGTAAVTGVGTAFTTELIVGNAIKIGSEIFTVSVITNATNLTLDSNHVAGASGATAYRDPSFFVIDNGDAVNMLTLTKDGNITTAGNVTTAGDVNVNGGNIDTTASLLAIENVLYVDGPNGKVGIGTNSPGELLTLYKPTVGTTPARLKLQTSNADSAILTEWGYAGGTGIVGLSQNLYWNDAGANATFTAANPGWRLYMSTNSDAFSISRTPASSLTETVSLYINSSNNVGIGDTSPGYKLEVADSSAVTTYALSLINDYGGIADLDTVGIRMGRSGNSWGAILGGQQAASNFSGGKLYLQTETSDGAGLETKMTIDSAGNVGIGTTNPLNKLDFGTSVPNVAKILTLYQSGTTMMGFGMSGSTAGMRIFGPTSTADEITFGSYDGTTYTEQMRINNLGNVGIGTTGPSAKLHTLIAGNNPTRPSGTWAGLIENTVDTDTGQNGLSVATRWGGSSSTVFQAASYWTGGAESYTPILTVKANLVVGIGTTAPNRKLDIMSGNADGITFGQDADDSQTIQTYINDQWAARTTYAGACCNQLKIQPDVGYVTIGGPVYLNSNSSGSGLTANGTSNLVGTVYKNGTAFAAMNGQVNGRVRAYDTGCAGFWASPCDGSQNGWPDYSDAVLSDQRLKTVTGSLTNVLPKLGEIEAVYYEWNDLYKETNLPIHGEQEIGLLAQDVQEQFPELVFKEAPGDEYLRLDYPKLTAVLLEGVKALDLRTQGIYTSDGGDVVINDGNVGIGTQSPNYDLEVAGDIAANSFVNVSTRDSKKDISYIEARSKNQELSILDDIKGLKIAQYHYKNESSSDPLRLGLIAEETPSIVLSNNGKGVDLYKLTTLAIGGIQAQQKDLDDIKAKVAKIEEDSIAPLQNDILALKDRFMQLMDEIINIKDSIASLQNDIATKILNTDFLTLNSKLISPVVETDNLQVNQVASIKNLVSEKIEPKDQELTIDLSENNDIEGGQLSKLIIKGLNDNKVAEFDAAGNATFSGTLTSAKIETSEASISGKLIAKEIESDNINALTSDLNSSKTDINEIQSFLADIQNQPVSNVANYQDAETMNNLNVTGDTSLYRVFISNTLTAGNILFEDNKIMSLDFELKLTALSSINLLDGQVIISKTGGLTSKGTITAEAGIKTNKIEPLNPDENVFVKNLETNKLQITDKYLEATTSASIITASENFNTNGIYSPAIETNIETAGIGLIKRQDEEIIVYNDSITKDSLVYLTPTINTNDNVLSVTEKEYCVPTSPSATLGASNVCKPYFKVTTSGQRTNDVKFNWLIIN